MIQLQALNRILKEKDSSFIVLNNLTEEYFSEYQDEFNFIKNHLERYGNIPDLETFLSRFTDFEVINVEEKSSYLASELVGDKNTRNLATLFNKIRTLLMDGKTDEAVTLFKYSSENISTGVALQCVDILKDTSRYDSYVERTKDFNKFYIKTGFQELDKIVGGWDREEELGTIVARTNYGKCLAKGTKVMMHDGTTKCVEDVKIGDKVQSYNRVNTVLALHNGVSNGYKITPFRGESFIVSSNHILTLYKRNEVLKPSLKGTKSTDGTGELVDIMIEDYLKMNNHNKRNMRLFSPSIFYDTKKLHIDPYILGTWLGDGTSREVSITSCDSEIINYWKMYAESFEYTLSKHNMSYSIVNRSGNKNKITELFKIYNLLNNKHIPLDYLTSDDTQRLQLLAGLLDTDGYLKWNVFSIVQKNEILIDEIAQLCRGLGFKVSKTTIYKSHSKQKNKNKYFNLSISGDINRIPTKLTRKQSHKNNTIKNPLLSGFKVEPIEYVEYYGFRCDGDERYLLFNNVLTHNTWILLKSAAAAAEQGLNVGIYSGEMSDKKVGYRLDTLISHLSNGSLTHGNIAVQNDYKKYIDDLPNKFKGTIKVLTPIMIDGPAGVNSLRTFIEKEKLDILFVDQHSLLEDDRKAKNPIERAANISKDLKNLQVMKRIPIISVSQQNRTTSDTGKVDTTQIAQSDRIGQDATMIIFLEKKDDIITLTLVKSRDSENGKSISYKVDFNKGMFVYIPESEDDNTSHSETETKYHGRYDVEVDGKEVF